MVSQNKLIKQGIKYTDKLFDEINHRLQQGVRDSDTLESFLEKTAPYTTSNPLVTTGYQNTITSLVLAEINNHRFSRPSQRELTRITIEDYVGNLIRNVGEDIRKNVRDIVKEGYNQSLPQQQIAENISQQVESIKLTRANTIARTEIARAATVSDYIINKERGATKFKVDCRGTCCEICEEEYDWGSQVYDIDDTDMLPPIHPNCRCVPFFFNDDTEPDTLKNDSLIEKEVRELQASDIENKEERIQKIRRYN